MFTTSTQRANWLFKDSNELVEIRKITNYEFIKKQNADVGILLNQLNIIKEKILIFGR
jgi:hypothetical protein